jgi:hypothetical protein
MSINGGIIWIEKEGSMLKPYLCIAGIPAAMYFLFQSGLLNATRGIPLNETIRGALLVAGYTIVGNQVCKMAVLSSK